FFNFGAICPAACPSGERCLWSEKLGSERSRHLLVPRVGVSDEPLAPIASEKGMIQSARVQETLALRVLWTWACDHDLAVVNPTNRGADARARYMILFFGAKRRLGYRVGHVFDGRHGLCWL